MTETMPKHDQAINHIAYILDISYNGGK